MLRKSLLLLLLLLWSLPLAYTQVASTNAGEVVQFTQSEYENLKAEFKKIKELSQSRTPLSLKQEIELASLNKSIQQYKTLTQILNSSLAKIEQTSQTLQTRLNELNKSYLQSTRELQKAKQQLNNRLYWAIGGTVGGLVIGFLTGLIVFISR